MKHKLPKFLTTLEGGFVVVVIVIVASLLGYYFYSGGIKKEESVASVAITAQDHITGKEGAVVTLVKFVDFQCPACGAYDPIVKQLLANNKETVRVVHKHFPLMQIHRNALSASIAAEAAGMQGKFFEMSEMLYAKQEEWSGTLNARDYYLAYASALTLNVAQFEKDLSNKALEEKILADLKEGVSLGVQGTPTFFVNGQKIDNPRDIESFDKLIKKAVSDISLK
jgi:protein-disulfide isomerase